MEGFEPSSFRRRILSPLCMPFHHICALYFGFWCMSNYSIEPCPSQAKLFCDWRGNRDAEHAPRYTRYGLFSVAGETNRNGGEMKGKHRRQLSQRPAKLTAMGEGWKENIDANPLLAACGANRNGGRYERWHRLQAFPSAGYANFCVRRCCLLFLTMKL